MTRMYREGFKLQYIKDCTFLLRHSICVNQAQIFVIRYRLYPKRSVIRMNLEEIKSKNKSIPVQLYPENKTQSLTRKQNAKHTLRYSSQTQLSAATICLVSSQLKPSSLKRFFTDLNKFLNVLCLFFKTSLP